MYLNLCLTVILCKVQKKEMYYQFIFGVPELCRVVLPPVPARVQHEGPDRPPAAGIRSYTRLVGRSHGAETRQAVHTPPEFRCQSRLNYKLSYHDVMLMM